MGMDFSRQIDIKEKFPVTAKMHETYEKRNAEIRAIFEGRSDKFILIIGPCSADHKEPVLEYLSRLARVSEDVRDKILIIPRIYTNKPRTTGDGYKGMLHQPDPDLRPDMIQGLIAIRELHMCAVRDYGFTCADEMLYPENYRYLSDLLAYVAVGARSVENQQHRLVSSGIEVPVGMKNPTGGDLSVMMNAVTAAQHPHTFIYSGWEVHSSGNSLAHSILRGYTDFAGKYVSNYHYEDLLDVCELYEKKNLFNPSVIVDVNHANSGKKNPDIRKLVKGIMIESYLEDGARNIGEHIFGKSITDACLGWEKSRNLIYDIADKL